MHRMTHVFEFLHHDRYTSVVFEFALEPSVEYGAGGSFCCVHDNKTRSTHRRTLDAAQDASGEPETTRKT